LRGAGLASSLADVKAADFFDLPASLPFAEAFDPEAPPWEWVSSIGRALEGLGSSRLPSSVPGGVHIEGAVYIHDSVKLPPYCFIGGPAWIGEGVEVRPGAFLRGNVIAGAGSTLGNACEFKNCLLMERAQVPHFSYVGDSILGNDTHLGAGVILSNLRLDQKPVRVERGSGPVDTGLRKLGAALGDGAEVGCNSVLMPGSVVGKRSLIGPLTSFKGTLAAGQVFMSQAEQRARARRD